MPLARSIPLTAWDRLGLVLLLAGAVLLGCVTVKRLALGELRRGDFAVYASAAWAVRTGGDLRQATCIRGWHYTYPPTLAVLLVPLAEPPHNRPDASALPVAVSAALWYVINVLCLAWGVHLLAGALEHVLGGNGLGTSPGRAWWRLRVFPLLACAPVVGESLTRGQVNLILLALVCGFTSALLRGRALRAGVYLAGAICLKVIPAFLLLVPLWRRDGRCLAGCAAGLVVIGLLIPMLGLGVQGTIDDYLALGQTVLGPGLGISKDERLGADLTNITCTHSQSPMAVIHTWMHPDRQNRPAQIPTWTRSLHWLMGGGLVLLMLLAGRDQCGWLRTQHPLSLWERVRVRGNRKAFANYTIPHPGPLPKGEGGIASREMPAGLRLTLFVGLLLINMLLLSPVCHSHYLCLAIPAFTALLAWDWLGRDDDWISGKLTLLMGIYVVANTVPLFPGMLILDDGGMAGVALLLVWVFGAWQFWQACPATIARAARAAPHAAAHWASHYRLRQVSPSTSFSTSSET